MPVEAMQVACETLHGEFSNLLLSLLLLALGLPALLVLKRPPLLRELILCVAGSTAHRCELQSLPFTY